MGVIHRIPDQNYIFTLEGPRYLYMGGVRVIIGHSTANKNIVDGCRNCYATRAQSTGTLQSSKPNVSKAIE